MRFLLDTNVLLWVVAGSPRVFRHRERLLDPANEVFVSVASLWEVAIKTGTGKLDVDVAALRQAASDSLTPTRSQEGVEQIRLRLPSSVPNGFSMVLRIVYLGSDP